MNQTHLHDIKCTFLQLISINKYKFLLLYSGSGLSYMHVRQTTDLYSTVHTLATSYERDLRIHFALLNNKSALFASCHLLHFKRLHQPLLGQCIT